MASVITQTVAASTDNWKVIKFACTAHTDGSFTAVTTESAIQSVIRDWGLYKASVVVGGTAPTASSDFTVTNSFGVDLLGGQGADAIPSSGTAERHCIIGPLYTAAVQPVVTPLTLTITGNSVNGATFDIYLYFKRPE